VGTRLLTRIRELEKQAIAVMIEHGLTVHPVSPSVKEEWRKLLREAGYPVFVGPRVSQEMFDAVRSLLDEYRATHLKTVTESQ
jgi:hypothetical protein